MGRLKKDERTRNSRKTKIDGIVDGNPPWIPKRLIDLQQGHRCNFNLREAEGAVETAKTPYYDLLFEVDKFAQIKFNYDIAPADIICEWGDKISEEYHYILDEWDGFDRNIQVSQYQMVLHGLGPMFWPHSLSWQSEAVTSGRVLAERNEKASIDDLEKLVILHSFRADEMEGFISNERAGTSAGWDVSLVKQTIIKSTNEDFKKVYGTED